MRIECYKYTDDPSWHPCYPHNCVKLMIMSLTSGDFRVAVWGNDDFGMDYDFEKLIDAQNMFYQICLLEAVNKEILTNLGFTRF